MNFINKLTLQNARIRCNIEKKIVFCIYYVNKIYLYKSINYRYKKKYNSIPYRNMTNQNSKTEIGIEPPTEIQDTIFGKIARKEIPVSFVYEDDLCFVIDDINPCAPVHCLVIPKKPIQQLSHAEECDINLLGHLLYVAKKVATIKEITNGFRVVINDGKEACQTVYHLHVHVLGNRTFSWPPG